MKVIASAGSIVALVIAATVCNAQDQPPKVEPTKQHEWLRQLVGEWDGDVGDGVANARMLGGLWLVSDVKVMIGDTTMTAVWTVGYDPQKKKYVGTWVDSVTPYLWTYEGSLDASGRILTLETEGPNPTAGGKMTKMRDAIEITDKEHFALSSSMRDDAGKWNTFMTVNYRRKK